MLGDMKTFKVRLSPNKTQEEFLWEQCRLSRNLYNDLLNIFKLKPTLPLSYIQSQRELTSWSHFSLSKMVSPLRNSGEKYDRLLSDSAGTVCKDLSVAIQEFFKRCKKGEPSELQYRNFIDNNSFSILSINQKIISDINNGYLGLSSPNVGGKRVKLGKIKIADRGDFHTNIKLENIKQIKIVRDGKYWFASIVQDKFIEDRKSKLGAIGIDMGVTIPVATSKNDEFNLPKEDIQYWQKRLKFYQRKLSKQQGGRGVKSSNRRNKTKKHIQRCHRKISDIREYWQHGVTHDLTMNNHIICMEDLKTSNMTKSAKGDSENHGKNVKAKSGLNREILNVGFYGIKQKFEYKTKFKGGQLVLVNPQNTSRECFNCGHTEKDNRKTQSMFKCVKCGHTENADFNASKNILKKGLILLENSV